MENRAYDGKPIPERQFKARYWNAEQPYPLLPVTLEDGESLTEQKIINNVIALNLEHRRQLAETREAEECHRRDMIRLHSRIRKLENLIAFALLLFIGLGVLVGLIYRALQ
jgi:hypothetical protein